MLKNKYKISVKQTRVTLYEIYSSVLLKSANEKRVELTKNRVSIYEIYPSSLVEYADERELEDIKREFIRHKKKEKN